MYKFHILIIITLFMMSSSISEEPSLDYLNKELLCYSIDKQFQYAELTESESARILFEYAYISDEMFDFFTRLRCITPRAAIILTSSSDFSIDEWLNQHALPNDYRHTLCFRRMFHDTNTFGDTRLADITSDIAIFDVATIDNIPSICYVILVYDSNTPQIVTAFSKVSDNSAISYTTFVYAKDYKVEYDESYFAYHVCTYWGVDAINVEIIVLEETPQV